MNKDTTNQKLSQSLLKTDGGRTKSNAINIPSIALPKGGGSIKGIDEKFSVNAVNGTAGFSMPLPVSEARGFSPSLTISYDSGNGNGIFGLGWSIDIPSIKRKTDTRLPRYDDATDSDTFLLSDSEDLVPEFKKNDQGDFIKDKGEYVLHETERSWFGKNYLVKRYRPRIEGAFSRIEKWTEKNSLATHWRTISNNVISFFGNSEKSRIADPDDDQIVFQWLLEFSYDDKGNCTWFEYRKENDDQLPSTLHNKNRKKSKLLYTNAYIKRVLYGVKIPYKNNGEAYPKSSADYFFETVFDYGEHDTTPPFNESSLWRFRTDAFSDYKAGFEIRTTRLCRRVMLYHHFTELPGGSALVRSFDCSYSSGEMDSLSFLSQIVIRGYIKQANGVYTQKELPPMDFTYQSHEWNAEIKSLDPDELDASLAAFAGGELHFSDLFGEGLPGILSEQANGWYYKNNLGAGRFSKAALVAAKPSFAGLDQQLQLMDLEANGIKQLVQLETEPKGFFELNQEDEWQPFTAFEKTAYAGQKEFSRLIDLTGDGLADILFSEPDGFTWYASIGRKGYEAKGKVNHSLDEEAAPSLVFLDQVQSIFLADMTGDGLTDIVRIKNSEISFWPNLGYARFGAKVSLDNAPAFDHPDLFNPAWIRLADIDGSGTNDIIYFGKNKCSVYLNRQGNSVSDARLIEPFPEINNMSEIDVADVLGTGLPCIVWGSTLKKHAAQPARYIDLMNSSKPHIMIGFDSNMGKKVSLEYRSSAWFYLDDKRAGKPWITKLHFPVHCLSRSTTTDLVAGSVFTSTYKYHHGYYDHHEKEFRGFGMVEQTDTEKYEDWSLTGASNIVDKELHQDPVLSRSWFHTGAFIGGQRILDHFKHEYWYEEMARQGFQVQNNETTLPEARVIADPKIDAAILEKLSADEWREALRACKGMSLRAELFALDAPVAGATQIQIQNQLTPFTVDTGNCVVELLQPRGKNEYAVFCVKESEGISYSYERDTSDPRISHSLNIKLDEYGNVLESASVVYPRVKTTSLPLETRDAQKKTAIIYSKSDFTNDVTGDDVHLLRIPAESQTFELKGVPKSGALFTIADFKNVFDTTLSEEAAYHETDKAVTPGKLQRRLTEHSRSIYLSNDLRTPLPLYKIESLAFEFESYQLAFTPALLTDIFDTKVNDTLMTEGKFIHLPGDPNWWIRSGTAEIITTGETSNNGRDRFYFPVSFTDPFGAKTKVKYYSNYFLFTEETEDALGNKLTVELFNFRSLSPRRMSDANLNISEVLSDELGTVKALAICGKGNEADDLTGLFEYRTTADDALITSFLANGKIFRYTPVDTDANELLKHATTRFIYDPHAFKNNSQPVVIATIGREQHFAKNNNSPLQLSFEYSNGLGESLMKKVQTEPGPAWQSDGNGTRTEINTTPFLRWIGNGRTILNNKGNAVRQYEPYFSTTHRFENQKELVETGVSPVTYYDALGRAIRTEFPDGSFTKVEFDSWKQINYDQHDVCKDLRCSWYYNRINHTIDARLLAEGKDPASEESAATSAAKHDSTPVVQHLDTLGRIVLSIDHDKDVLANTDEFFHTSQSLDTEGNLRGVTDARGNKVMVYKYDMLGNKLYQESADMGKRWLLPDIAGKPLRTWDERLHECQYSYDVLQRPLVTKVLGGDGAAPLNHIINKIIYGESQSFPENKNLRGQVFRNYDTGGMMETPAYDFDGKAMSVKKTLFKKYKEVANWTDANLVSDLETESFTFITETDALGRTTKETAPDGSVFIPSYNEAGLLTSEKIDHADPVSTVTYIKDIDYDEKRQRSRVVYGNGVITHYKYDKLTFRLIAKTTRRADSSLLQDIHYTFDAVGNITHIQDNAIPTVFYDNMRVEPAIEYTYDALYRLVQASGRENDGTLAHDGQDNWHDNAFKHSMNPGDPMAARNYTQQYEYDKVNNIRRISHKTDNSSANWWTRDYEYETNNNRLKNTKLGQGANNFTYSYPHQPKHGFITAMPHLEELGWNFSDELFKTVRQRRTDGGTPETTWYQYDGQGQRIRKITDNQADAGITPSKKEERIYMGGYQLYKKHSGANAGLQRKSLSLSDEGHRFVMIETRNEVDDGTEKQLTRYQLHNHLGSACLELDGTDQAKVISYEEYHPYGTTAYQVRNNAIKSAAKQYRYTGMERDEETGFEYHGARYYLPWLGRWLNADPIGIKGGINVYEYGDSCPVLNTDVSGTAPPKKKSKPRSPERKHGAKQQKAHRQKLGLKGATWQAGHLATVRDAKLSKIPNSFWDKIKLMTLHSRRGRGLDVEVTNQNGTKTTNTRHTAQEKISDINTARSVAEQGKLYPRAQKYNAEQFEWQVENTPYSKENIEKVRKSGRAPESKLDANVNPKTGVVEEGPKTDAARQRRTDKLAKEVPAAAETPVVEKAPAAQGEKVNVPKEKVTTEVKTTVKVTTKGSRVLRTTSKVGGGVIGGILLGVAVKDTVTQIQQGDYVGAATTTGLTAASFTPAAPLVIAYGIIDKYNTDTTIEERSFAVGDKVLEKTGSPVLGGIASAGAAVGISTYETGKDMYNAAVDFVDWGVTKIFFDD